MKRLFITIKYFFMIFFLSYNTEFIAENHDKAGIQNITKNEIIIESDKQMSETSNSIFYAEGNVLLTNLKKDFVANSNKAIFYKSDGKIILVGNVEVKLDSDKIIRAGEVVYYLNENKFEAISNQSQRVNTTLSIDELEISR